MVVCFALSFISLAATPLSNLSNTGVPITVTVPAIVTGLSANVSGISVPGAQLQLFVNNVSQRILSVPPDGNYSFGSVQFVEGNNSLRIVARNNGLQTSFTTFIQADATPPVLTVAPMPAVANVQSVLLNGSVNEPSTILIKVRNLVGDGKVPKNPANLLVAEITANGVQLNWTPINQSDNPTYIIYRNGVPIASTTQRRFDDVSLNTQTSYTYFVTARDGECLESAPSNSLTIVTHAGGQQITNISSQGPQECVPQVVQRSFIAFGLFSTPLSLSRGLNIISVNATNNVGLTAQQTFQMTLNNRPPNIVQHNLGKLTPSYDDVIAVEGKVDKEVGEDVLVQVFVNDELDATTSAREDGSFKVDVELSRKVTISGENLNPNYDPLRQSAAIVKEEQGFANKIRIVATDSGGLKDEAEQEVVLASCGFGSFFSVSISNPLPDLLNPRLVVEGYGTIGFNFELDYKGLENASVSEVRIKPRELSVKDKEDWDLQMLGGVQRFLSRDKQKGFVQINIKPINDNRASKKSNQTTFALEKGITDNRKGKCLLAGYGCVRIPLVMEVSFAKKSATSILPLGSTSQQPFVDQTLNPNLDQANDNVQRECINVEVAVDRRLPTNKIPSDFLKGSIRFLNATINAIDAIVEPLTTINEITFYACAGSWVTDFFLAASEHFNCDISSGIGIFTQSTFDPDIARTGQCADVYEPNSEQLSKCESCQSSVSSRKSFESTRNLLCDRIFCPSIPSFQAFVGREQGLQRGDQKIIRWSQGSTDTGIKKDIIGVATDTRSDCAWPEIGQTYYGVDSFNSEYSGPFIGIRDLFLHYSENDPAKMPYLEAQRYTQKGGVKKPDLDCTVLHPSDPRCCVYEYMRVWNNGCLVMNEFEESACFAAQDAGAVQDFENNLGGSCNKLWNSVAGFCEPDGKQPVEIVHSPFSYPVVQCQRNNDCGSGVRNVCSGGRCVQCVDDKDCVPYSGTVCKLNQCVGKEFNVESSSTRTPPQTGGTPVFGSPPSEGVFSFITGNQVLRSPAEITEKYGQIYTAQGYASNTNQECGLKGFKFRMTDDTGVYYRIIKDKDGQLQVHRGFMTEHRYIEDASVQGSKGIGFRSYENGGSYDNIDSLSGVRQVFRPASKNLAEYFVQKDPDKIRSEKESILRGDSKSSISYSAQNNKYVGGVDTSDPQFLGFYNELGKCVQLNAQDYRDVRSLFNRIKQASFSDQKQFVADPTSSMLRSAQCVCLTGLRSYLKFYQGMMKAVRGCFETVLLTGDGSPGVCRAVLSTYVCDLAFDLINCFSDKYAGSGGRFEGGIGDVFGALTKAGSDVQSSVSERYGDSALYKNMFSKKDLVHSICLFAFTGTWDLDVTGFLEEDISIPIQSQPLLYPAERRFISYNPVTNPSGLATFSYHLGVGLFAGSDLTYRVSLVCSDGYDCRGGACDCVNVGRKERIVSVGRGSLRAGDILDQEVFINVPDSPWRFDRVVIKWVSKDSNRQSSLKNGQKIQGPTDGEFETTIKDTGGLPPAECGFDIAEGSYRCGFGFGNENYIRFFTNPFPIQTEPYKVGQVITVNLKASQHQPVDAERKCIATELCEYTKFLVMTLYNQYNQEVAKTAAIPYNGNVIHEERTLPGFKIEQAWFARETSQRTVDAQVLGDAHQRINIVSRNAGNRQVQTNVDLVFQGGTLWQVVDKVSGTVLGEIQGPYRLEYDGRFVVNVEPRGVGPRNGDRINVQVFDVVRFQNQQIDCPDSVVNFKLKSAFYDADAYGYLTAQTHVYDGKQQVAETAIPVQCRDPAKGPIGYSNSCREGVRLTSACVCRDVSSDIADCGKVGSGNFCLDNVCWREEDMVYPDTTRINWCPDSAASTAIAGSDCLCSGVGGRSNIGGNVCPQVNPTRQFCWDSDTDGVRECNPTALFGIDRLTINNIADASKKYGVFPDDNNLFQVFITPLPSAIAIKPSEYSIKVTAGEWSATVPAATPAVNGAYPLALNNLEILNDQLYDFTASIGIPGSRQVKSLKDVYVSITKCTLGSVSATVPDAKFCFPGSCSDYSTLRPANGEGVCVGGFSCCEKK